MITILGRAICFFAILATLTSFAHLQAASEQDAGIAAINVVLENFSDCVGWIDEDRIYLRGDKIFVEDGRVFIALNDEGDCAALPLLESDHHGSFLRGALSVRTEAGEKFKSKCPDCGNYQYTFAFGCNNPRCPSHERVAEYQRMKEENARREKERKEVEKRGK